MGKQKEKAIGRSMANATLCYQEFRIIMKKIFISYSLFSESLDLLV
jgi:hypothetical protein